MKLALAFFGLVSISSAAFADGAPVMECSGTAGKTHVSVLVDRSIVQGIPKFVDTLKATTTTEGDDATRILGIEVANYEIRGSQDEGYVGPTLNLRMTYVGQESRNSVGAYDAFYNAKLSVVGTTESYVLTCVMHDHY